MAVGSAGAGVGYMLHAREATRSAEMAMSSFRGSDIWFFQAVIMQRNGVDDLVIELKQGDGCQLTSLYICFPTAMKYEQ